MTTTNTTAEILASYAEMAKRHAGAGFHLNKPIVDHMRADRGPLGQASEVTFAVAVHEDGTESAIGLVDRAFCESLIGRTLADARAESRRGWTRRVALVRAERIRAEAVECATVH